MPRKNPPRNAPPRGEEKPATFELADGDARNVSLVCEANGWQPVEMRKSRKGGGFRAKMRLPKQRQFQFRYLVDERRWVNDAEADAYRRNEFGSENGILDTTPAVVQPATEAPRA